MLELFDKLSKHEGLIRTIPIKKFGLKGAFGEKGAIVTYKVQIDVRYLEIEMTHEFYVVKNLTYPMIMGMDFLAQYGANLKCQGRKFDIRFVNKLEKQPGIRAISRIDSERELEKIIVS